MKLKHIAFILMAALPMSLSANTAPASTIKSGNIVSFSTEVEKEVAQDLLQVTLFIQAENAALPKANQEVNSKINQALEIIKAQSAVEIKQNSRNTYVRYNQQGKQNGWVASGQLVLQSADSEALSKILSDLDGILAISSVNALVSPETIAKSEDELTTKVLKKFERQAQLIKTTLKAKDYAIVELNLTSPIENDDIVARPYGAMARVAKVDDNSVKLEQGKTQLKARLDAKIELVK
ncbi:SIMPL domain-containing protein [[Pasteurella] aerogenes]